MVTSRYVCSHNNSHSAYAIVRKSMAAIMEYSCLVCFQFSEDHIDYCISGIHSGDNNPTVDDPSTTLCDDDLPPRSQGQ